MSTYLLHLRLHRGLMWRLCTFFQIIYWCLALTLSMREIKLRNSVVTVIYFWWEWTSPLPRAQLILSLPWGNSVLHGSKQRHAAHHSQTLWRSFSKNVGCRFGIQVKGKQRKRIFFEERYFFFHWIWNRKPVGPPALFFITSYWISCRCQYVEINDSFFTCTRLPILP